MENMAENETRAKYRVIWLTADGRRKTRYPSTTRKVAGILRSLDVAEVDLRVLYVRGDVVVSENSGHYTNREQWLTAWYAFSESDLLDWMNLPGSKVMAA